MLVQCVCLLIYDSGVMWGNNNSKDAATHKDDGHNERNTLRHKLLRTHENTDIMCAHVFLTIGCNLSELSKVKDQTLFSECFVEYLSRCLEAMTAKVIEKEASLTIFITRIVRLTMTYSVSNRASIYAHRTMEQLNEKQSSRI